MNKIIFVFFISIFFKMNGQSNQIDRIQWKGIKKMDVPFMTDFILTKVATKIDSLKLNKDIAALTRLNGISKVSFEIVANEFQNQEVIFTIVEDFSIIPNTSIWSTEETTAYRVGIYDVNFLGKNNTIGCFYQYNGLPSFGLSYASPFLFNSKLGLETSFQKLATLEPIFFENTKARYQYINTSGDLSASYRIDYRNSCKLGFSYFNEAYQYQNGATSSNVPQSVSIDKYLIKLNYLFDNLQYDYYLVNGFRSASSFQYVRATEGSKPSFIIGWNDFSFFKRFGRNGNWANRLRLGLSSNDKTPFAPFSVDNNLNIRGVGNIIDRGTGTIVINSEFRKTLYEKNWFVLQGNAFIDAGTWRQPGEQFDNFFDKRNMRAYPGVGLRFMHKTIFNAIFRLDYGFGITKNASNGIVFGIGQYF